MKINLETGTDMTRRACKTTLALLLLSLSTTPALGQNYFMYAPRTANPGEKTNPKDGVLVREIEVQKGDTLSGISRKFSGHGSYYPQILLLNDIKNPHLIHNGERIRVPVSKSEPAEQHKQAATPPSAQQTKSGRANQAASEISLNDLKKPDTVAGKKTARRGRRLKHRAAAHSTRNQTASARKQFNQALVSYRNRNWHTALKQFDRFLANNPSSELAADASLYKAECYLKLSDQ
jgi:LysM repeat protein